jgi:hypothetical protein
MGDRTNQWARLDVEVEVVLWRKIVVSMKKMQSVFGD